MSWQRDDAVRAGISTGFGLLGASIVIGAQMETGPALLLLALSAPLTALLAGVYAYRSALYGGDR